MNLALIQTASVAFNASQTVALFHGPIPIISNEDPLAVRIDSVAGLSARLNADGMVNRFPMADRFSTAAAALARFNKAN